MSKTCNRCGHAIERWQSYHIDGTSCEHLQCALGHTPATHPTAHYNHSNTQFNKGDLRRERHTITSDEGIVFDVKEE